MMSHFCFIVVRLFSRSNLGARDELIYQAILLPLLLVKIDG